jgi:RNA polymerase sigma factor (sigma-70 family)
LDASDSESRDQAWAAFVQAHSRLLLHTAKVSANGYDDIMDRFAYVLDQLRCDDFRRLRKYASDGRTMFSTWLVVVARRLCIDYHRSQYGRPRPPKGKHSGHRAALEERRDLIDLLGAHIDIAAIEDRSTPDPDSALRTGELRRALEQALSQLAPRDRMLLRLRFEDGASVKEITRIMDFPSQFHVYRQLKAVLSRLRQSLEVQGVREATP